MPRVRRIVVTGLPHHVTQRGNRRCDVFLDDQDRRVFLRLLRQSSKLHSLQNTAYCLMTNHIHLISTPEVAHGLSRVMRAVLGTYAQYFNQKRGLSGRLWQGRFYSCVLDDSHFWTAVRYVERNPVRAGMVSSAEDYKWSSAAAHSSSRGDPMLSPLPDSDSIPDWSAWLSRKDDQGELKTLRDQTKAGRPCGSKAFVDELEGTLGRSLRPSKGGRPRKN